MAASPQVPNHIGQNRFASFTNVETGITAGTTQTQVGATQLTAQMNRVDTVAVTSDGVKLPKITATPGVLGSVGTIIALTNNASNTMKVYGGLLDTINAVASATGNSVTGGVSVLLWATSYNPTTGVGTWRMMNSTASAVAAFTSGTIAGAAISTSSFAGSSTYASTFAGTMVPTQGNPATATNTAGITAANMLTGIIVGTPTAAAAYTVPDGTTMDAAVTFNVGDSFDWSIINVATNDTFIITLTAATTHTLVGVPTVPANGSTTGALTGASARFRTRKTATNTFVTYRIA